MASPKLMGNSPRIKTGQARRILVVENENLLREKFILALEAEDYEIITTSRAQTALALLKSFEKNQKSFPVDLIILDLVMSQADGLGLCRLLRSQEVLVPILIFTDANSEADSLSGIEVGADDYLAKPFEMQNLVTRCQILLRRSYLTRQPTSAVLQFKEIILYPEDCRVTIQEGEVKLTLKELRLLELFIRHPH